MFRLVVKFVGIWAGLILVFGLVDVIQSKADRDAVQDTRHLLWLGEEGGFGDLERPSVGFDHDAHTGELDQAECDVCHVLEKEVKGKKIGIYEFPKKSPSDGRKVLMEAYHRACMSCHKTRLDQGKKSGPVVCGGCHLEAKPESARWREMAYDYAIHHKHVQAMDSKCETCHHVFDEEQEKLVYKEGEESSCRDCHGIKDEENRRSFRHVAHAQCLNCHMEKNEKEFDSGPVKCSGCHGERERMPIHEMAKLPRLERGQEDNILIAIDEGRMKGTAFDHKSHEDRVRFCRDCHHSTHQPCSSCHTLTGHPEGAGITLEAAFHHPDSPYSCFGCHNDEKESERCLGCHISDRREIPEDSCTYCHRGTLEPRAENAIDRVLKKLPSEKVPEEVEIKILENEYQPAVFPHRKVVKALIDRAHESQLADYFHAHRASICLGCHHESPFDLNEKPPTCGSCHGIENNPSDLQKPKLLAAYHRQCMGCHEEMQIEKMECADCHEEKENAFPKTLEKIIGAVGDEGDAGGDGSEYVD